jgi:aminopeptidase YwaD
MNQLSQLFNETLSGEKAHETVKQITQFYRSPGSAGFHAATNIIADMLRAGGFEDLEVTRYPINGETEFNHRTLPLAWEPYSAVVRMTNPAQQELVNFDSAPSCLAWWSTPTPPGGQSADVIDVGTGESEEDFAGKDLKDKVAFIHTTNRPEGWMYASGLALEKGAVGILTDYFLYPMPPDRVQEKVPNAVQLLRLGANNHGKYQAWACSVNYPTGKMLSEMLALGPVTIHADIQCRLFKGEGQNLLATIPGRELAEEAVFFLSHTSTGTKPGANCAAGVALATEIALTMRKLIEEGKLERPRRSIKFLFVNEGLGSQAYIAAHKEELPGVKASFCFCSAGNDQQKSKSVLIFSKNPDSVPSFLNDYYQWVMDTSEKDKYWVGRDEKDMSSVVFEQVPYTPWSDNSAWAAFGVPSGLVMSWPDIYFHSQLLTADTVDPKVIKRAGMTTAIAAYEIANADLSTAEFIASEVFTRSQYRLQRLGNDTLRYLSSQPGDENISEIESQVKHVVKELRYFAGRDTKALATTKGLVGKDIPDDFEKKLAGYQGRLAQEAEQQVEAVVAVFSRLQGQK